VDLKQRKSFSDRTDKEEEENPQFLINPDKIKNMEDMRTSIMIKNIPNKIQQTNILQEIDRNNKGRYNFFYMPIDFSNDYANMGYAFINFLNPIFIMDFYNEFNNKKWKQYNSKKICKIRYGRI
jgi:hypothetical protein